MLNTIVFLITSQSALLTWLFFIFALRKTIQKKQVWVWFGLTLLAEAVAIGLMAVGPYWPKGISGILPFFLVNSVMLTWITKINWVTVVPLLVIFDSFRRFVGGVTGLIVQFFLTPTLTIYTRSVFQNNFSLVMELNQLIAVIIGLILFPLFGLWAGRLNNRYRVVDRLVVLRPDGSDYVLVAMYFSVYFIALSAALSQKLQFLTDFTLFLAMLLGAFYYYLVLSRFEQSRSEQLLESLRGYDASVSRMNEEMHRVSHDYQNILLGLSYFVKRSNDEEMQTYFAQVTHDNNQRLANMDNGDIERLRYLSSGYIKGLLYSKLIDAEKRQIKFDVRINEGIQLREERSIDLVRIFGNVLDNALDAAEESDKVVQLSAAPTEKCNVFRVTNMIPGDTTIDLSKVARFGVTTKQGHMGIGMSNIRRLARQGITVEQTIDDRQFVTTIHVPKA
ncbi:sensor histidine kinase [Furfurilactobacillus cerevisiae]|uniref:sensor histidine kinase n=1 Tax=Furfurilactobacillus rossiae TaxID=231049 RepID=UPI003B985BCF